MVAEKSPDLKGGATLALRDALQATSARPGMLSAELILVWNAARHHFASACA